MRILFISLAALDNLEEQSIYGDLLKCFVAHEHEVTAMYPCEPQYHLQPGAFIQHGIRVIGVPTGDITQSSFMEKGISLLRLKGQVLRALDEHCAEERFDLVLFATPPTTISGVIKAVKKRTGAKAYLLLKDIFPQNAVDLGILSEYGPKALLLKYFKGTERKTYEVADYIGCMSPANVKYLLAHNPQIDPSRVEVCPNSITPLDVTDEMREAGAKLVDLPRDRPLLVYGGNLGRPQCVSFLIEFLQANERTGGKVCVAVAGSGTDRHLLDEWFERESPAYAQLLPRLPRREFDALLATADAGLILLDHRFTIPNFPSRALSYMQASLPLIVASDKTCDMGLIAVEGGFGAWCESSDAAALLDLCASYTVEEFRAMGKRARDYLERYYTAERSCQIIAERINEIV